MCVYVWKLLYFNTISPDFNTISPKLQPHLVFDSLYQLCSII